MKPPTDLSQPDAPMATLGHRYHDLDALRAFAMLLGIVLHGVMSFMPLPGMWPAQDITLHENYFIILFFIHGFRMPLFFMVSGFFTVMMWRRRGLAALAGHRARRILIPLAVAVIVLVPILNNIPRLVEHNTIWSAAKRGDTGAIAAAIERGDPVNGRDEMQATALHWAAAYDHAESIEALLNQGAKINAGDGKDSTPLQWAVMLGGTDATRILMGKGASARRTNADGVSALNMVDMDKGTTKWLAGILGIEVDIDGVMAARPGIGDLLRGRKTPSPNRPPGGKPAGAGQSGSGDFITDNYTIDFFSERVFILHHLWFLYDLILLVAGFVLVVALARLVGRPQFWNLLPLLVKRIIKTLCRPPFCWLWIIPLSLWTHRDMKEFGPATAVGLEIDARILTHYAVFFLAGTLCYGSSGFGRISRTWWPLLLLLALVPFGVGIDMLDKPGEDAQFILPVASVAFCWLMIFALIGFSRRFFSGEKPRVRYVSDSSYWLYLAHMPVVQVIQIWVSHWQYPGPLKFVFVCALSTGILLLSYQYLVRYTFIGTALNGRRTRPGPVAA